VEYSATKKEWDGSLQIMVADGTLLKGHIFDQVILTSVTYDGNKNQIILSYAVVAFKTDGNWEWFRCQLEQDFSGSYNLIVDYSK
jgi:hypothetical protein